MSTNVFTISKDGLNGLRSTFGIPTNPMDEYTSKTYWHRVIALFRPYVGDGLVQTMCGTLCIDDMELIRAISYIMTDNSKQVFVKCIEDEMVFYTPHGCEAQWVWYNFEQAHDASFWKVRDSFMTE